MKDALRLMRIPFSIYLMPIFWFALSAQPAFEVWRAVAVFLILHLLVYPASNGYNSYFDRDEGSIGGLKHPPRVTKTLFRLVLFFDLLALLAAASLSLAFGACILVYLLVSKAYSYDKIRLKKYPWLSTLVVVVFQGAFTFLMVQVGVNLNYQLIFAPANLVLAGVSSLFLCGSYPLTQIYQHAEDSRRGDQTLSLILGIRGTLVFAALSLLLATCLLLLAYGNQQEYRNIYIFLLCTAPVLAFFSSWVLKIRRDPGQANFENTMRMNQISSLSISLAFGLILFTS
ncbi:MAG: UbiA family prenyltransferase [Adhaeribacter sp.]